MIAQDFAVFFAIGAFDLRAGFDVLAGHVARALSLDPRSGVLVLFANKARNRVKVLWYDRNGYVVLYKRLDKGTFPLPEVDAPSVRGGGSFNPVTTLNGKEGSYLSSTKLGRCS